MQASVRHSRGDAEAEGNNIAPYTCRCEHHFHKDCVHEWLALNSVCPLCKRDFRGKTESNEGESAGSEEPH